MTEDGPNKDKPKKKTLDIIKSKFKKPKGTKPTPDVALLQIDPLIGLGFLALHTEQNLTNFNNFGVEGLWRVSGILSRAKELGNSLKAQNPLMQTDENDALSIVHALKNALNESKLYTILPEQTVAFEQNARNASDVQGCLQELNTLFDALLQKSPIAAFCLHQVFYLARKTLDAPVKNPANPDKPQKVDQEGFGRLLSAMIINAFNLDNDLKTVEDMQRSLQNNQKFQRAAAEFLQDPKFLQPFIQVYPQFKGEVPQLATELQGDLTIAVEEYPITTTTTGDSPSTEKSKASPAVVASQRAITSLGAKTDTKTTKPYDPVTSTDLSPSIQHFVEMCITNIDSQTQRLADQLTLALQGKTVSTKDIRENKQEPIKKQLENLKKLKTAISDPDLSVRELMYIALNFHISSPEGFTRDNPLMPILENIINKIDSDHPIDAFLGREIDLYRERIQALQADTSKITDPSSVTEININSKQSFRILSDTEQRILRTRDDTDKLLQELGTIKNTSYKLWPEGDDNPVEKLIQDVRKSKTSLKKPRG